MKSERLYEVLRHVRPLHQYSAHVVAAALEPAGISMPMRAVLERLADAGPLTVPQIARSLWIARQGVQKIVDEAKTLELVGARPNPQHKRSYLIELTERGHAVYDRIRADELVRLESLATGLDPSDIDAAIRVLGHLTRELRTMQDPNNPEAGLSAPGPRPGEEIR